MNRISRIIISAMLIMSIILSVGITAYANAEPFELPISGASGFASKDLYFLDAPNGGKILKTLTPGTAYTILGDASEDCLEVQLTDGSIGFVKKAHTLINLPDIIPSIIFMDTNSESSFFRSDLKDIPDVTGMQLYNVKAANPRFGGDVQYVMPLLYDMAIKVMNVQQEALSHGDCLIIYETYRPFETQMLVSKSLKALLSSDPDVYSTIHDGKWSESWFIGQSFSNHQIGRAMDCSLSKVLSTENRAIGRYSYTVVNLYEEYEMPTDMHELSPKAAVLVSPSKPSSLEAWHRKELTETFESSDGAMRLQKYCLAHGLSPLASEWWHFEDLSCSQAGAGGFYLLGGKPDSSGVIPEVYNKTSRIP